jgi:hypothetical protein
MEESEMLAKKRECLNFKKEEEQDLEYSGMDEITDINHYTFLRKTWTKFQSQEDNSIEKIDHLNKIINIIKTGIKKLEEK